jgi:hypothetical protein
MEISRAVNVVLYELFHFSVMLKCIAVVCDCYSTEKHVAGRMKNTRKW